MFSELVNVPVENIAIPAEFVEAAKAFTAMALMATLAGKAAENAVLAALDALDADAFAKHLDSLEKASEIIEDTEKEYALLTGGRVLHADAELILASMRKE